MRKPKPINLTKRWNKNGTISLLARGKVVFTAKRFDHAEAFIQGWYGNRTIVFNRSQFR